MRKLWPMTGGIKLPPTPIPAHDSKAMSLSAKLLLPLIPAIGPALTPVVKTGERVKKGQLIATAGGLMAVPVHAPSSGVVGDTLLATEIAVPTPAFIELFPDGEHTWLALHPNSDPFSLNREQLISAIKDAGITGMGGAGFPTAAKLAAVSDLHTLIINGVESDPYLGADGALLARDLVDVWSGAQLLGHVFKAKEIIFAVSARNRQAMTPEAMARLQNNPAENPNIEVVTLPDIYPSGSEQQLIQILTGQTFNRLQTPAASGILVQNVATVQAIWRALRFGEPLIHRWVSFTGSGLATPAVLRIPLGTPVNHVLRQLGWQDNGASQLSSGGALMAVTLNQAETPILKTTNGIVAANLTTKPDPEDCIRCGDCAKVCPASLLPQQLLWQSLDLQQGQDAAAEQLRHHNLFDCIECGACSYVCPSHIALVPIYQEAKLHLRQQQVDLARANRARTRFNHRNARFAKQDAEKAAKRQQRQAAAAAARTELDKAEQSRAAPGTLTTASTASQLIAEALARVAANATDPEQQAARLERNLAAARDRLTRAQAAYVESSQQDEARREKLRAAVKQAEQRLAEAENKLQEHRPSPSHETISADNILQKLAAAPANRIQSAVETLQKHLAIAQARLEEAQRENKPTIQALMLGVEKLQAKLRQAETELTQLDNPGAVLPIIDPVTLAAADRALQALAAKKLQSPEAKQAALRQSIERRIIQLEERIREAKEQQLPSLAALEESLATLKAKLVAEN